MGNSGPTTATCCNPVELLEIRISMQAYSAVFRAKNNPVGIPANLKFPKWPSALAAASSPLIDKSPAVATVNTLGPHLKRQP